MNKKFIKKFLCLGLAATATFAIVSCGDDVGNPSDYDTGTGEYTLNEAYSGTFTDGAWDPLDWENSIDSVPLSYTTMGFYNFDLNDAADGYDIDCEMASALPKDVTGDYAGQYNVPEDAADGDGYAFEISLNSSATFDDGEAIKAEDYVESYKLLIDSAYDNYRSTLFEADSLQFANSSFYHYQGETKLTTVSDVFDYDSVDASTIDSDANVAISATHTAGNEDGYWALTTYDYVDDVDTFTSDYPNADVNSSGYVYLGADYATALSQFETYMTAYGYGDYATEDQFLSDAYLYYTYPERTEDWFNENVGLKAIDDYTLLIVSDVACSEFNCEYTLTSNWLVETSKYIEDTTTASDGTKSSTYDKTLEDSVSYGPYKMSEYTNTGFALEKNDAWYGYDDGNHDGQYETTNIEYTYVESNTTQLEYFLQGDLDEVSLDSDSVSDYAYSDSLYDVPTSYSMSLFTNTDEDMLAALDEAGTTENAVVYSNLAFREAVSYSLDRETMENASPGASATVTMLDDLYISDAESGEVYRNTEAGESVISSIYGSDVTDVSDVYSVDKAVEYFNTAYEELTSEGLYTAGEDITFTIEYSNVSDTEYTQTNAYLQSYIQAALQQSDFGDITFTLTMSGTGSTRYNDVKSGVCVMGFCAWGGSTFDPYSLLQCYFTDDYNYMGGFSPTSTSVTINVDGTDVIKTYSDWYEAVSSGGEYSNSDSRTQILADLEAAYLSTFNITPLFAEGSKSLVSTQIEYGSDSYINGIGYGGIANITYSTDDAGWEAYVSACGGTVNYS